MEIFYSYGLFNSNCRETIKDFVTRGYNSKILPLPVSLFLSWITIFISYFKFLVILNLEVFFFFFFHESCRVMLMWYVVDLLVKE
jgi:hypothetical protein